MSLLNPTNASSLSQSILPDPVAPTALHLSDPCEAAERWAGGANLLAGQVCVVVGGASIAPGWGIGKAIAAVFAREGGRVAIADVNFDAAAEAANAIRNLGGDALPFHVDATQDDSIVALFKSIRKDIGEVDVLYNNVGLAKSGDPALTTPDDWRRIQDGNVTALHVATQAVLPGMKKRRKGVILTTSSIAAKRHLGYTSLAYAATKAAALHFTRTLAIDYARYGIRANTIVAGLIDTPRIAIYLKNAYAGCSVEEMRAKRHGVVPLGRMGNSWDIAEAAAFLASDRAQYITGAELIVDGGLSVTVPH